MPAVRPRPTPTRRSPLRCGSCQAVEGAWSPIRHKQGYPKDLISKSHEISKEVGMINKTLGIYYFSINTFS